MKKEMERFTISLDADLAQRFDQLIRRRGYGNRSEAVRDLLHRELAEEHLAHAEDAEGVGVLVYVYDHEDRALSSRLTRKQHQGHDLVQASLHVHLDRDRCLESVVLRGPVHRIKPLAQSIVSESGVRYGQLHMAPLMVGEVHTHGVEEETL